MLLLFDAFEIFILVFFRIMKVITNLLVFWQSTVFLVIVTSKKWIKLYFI